MDETLLYFDVVPNRILDRKGKKSIIIRTTGSQKRHLTVTLCVTHEGNVLPALAIFKSSRPLQIRAQKVFVCIQSKVWMDEDLMLEWMDEDIMLEWMDEDLMLEWMDEDLMLEWMDEELMLEWIKLVWEPTTEGKHALLILDSFSAHVTSALKELTVAQAKFNHWMSALVNLSSHL